MKKLITYQDYLDKYKKFHYEISKFYGDLSLETFNKNIEKIKILIKEEGKKSELRNKNQNSLFKGFLKFDIDKKDDGDILIIREWTRNTIYADLNKWLSNLDMNSFEAVAYFASRIMFSLNSYGQKAKKYSNINKKKLYGGEKLTYSHLLSYKKAKGKIITFSTLFETFESKGIGERYCGRNDPKSLYKTRH